MSVGGKELRVRESIFSLILTSEDSIEKRVLHAIKFGKDPIPVVKSKVSKELGDSDLTVTPNETGFLYQVGEITGTYTYRDFVRRIQMKNARDKVIMQTRNDCGLYKTVGEKRNGKPQFTLNWDGCMLVNAITGEVITSDLSPKYPDWNYEDYRNAYRDNPLNIRYLTPMFAKEPKDYEPGDQEVAEIKFDGHRALIYIGENSNRAFSRHISEVTGWYNENTDQLPHIRDLNLSPFAGTVIDGEIVWENSSKSKDMQSVMGALPETAIQNQYERGWVKLVAFDILYYKGVNIQKYPYWKRKNFLWDIIEYINDDLFFPYIEFAEIHATEEAFLNYPEDIKYPVTIVDSYSTLFEEQVEDGLEGIMLKNIFSKYEQGKKTSVKMKKKSTWDVFMIGLTEPTREYTGKLTESPEKLRKWPYWETRNGEVLEFKDGLSPQFDLDLYTPVTKPYAKGWCGGIIFGVWRDGEVVEVGTTKGLTEAVMEDLKENGELYVENYKVFEVMAEEVIDKDTGTLRHPRFFRWRYDKLNPECTWKDHIREDAMDEVAITMEDDENA